MYCKSLITAFILVLAALVPQVGTAQEPDESDDNRGQYINELRTYKHDFISRVLDLSRESQAAFFEVYDAMEDEILQLNEETRELERRINSSPEVSDGELEAAAEAVYNQKAREAEIESRYFDQFKQLLTPRQLFRLKGAERRFNQYIMRNHRRMRAEEPGRGPRR